LAGALYWGTSTVASFLFDSREGKTGKKMGGRNRKEERERRKKRVKGQK